MRVGGVTVAPPSITTQFQLPCPPLSWRSRSRLLKSQFCAFNFASRSTAAASAERGLLVEGCVTVAPMSLPADPARRMPLDSWIARQRKSDRTAKCLPRVDWLTWRSAVFAAAITLRLPCNPSAAWGEDMIVSVPPTCLPTATISFGASCRRAHPLPAPARAPSSDRCRLLGPRASAAWVPCRPPGAPFSGRAAGLHAGLTPLVSSFRPIAARATTQAPGRRGSAGR